VIPHAAAGIVTNADLGLAAPRRPRERTCYRSLVVSEKTTEPLQRPNSSASRLRQPTGNQWPCVRAFGRDNANWQVDVVARLAFPNCPIRINRIAGTVLEFSPIVIAGGLLGDRLALWWRCNGGLRLSRRASRRTPRTAADLEEADELDELPGLR